MSIINELGIIDTPTYEPTVVTVTVTSTTVDVATVRTTPPTGPSAELTLPVTEWWPHRPLPAPGATFQALRLSDGPNAVVSVTDPRFPVALLTAVCPEVRNGQVRVMGVARAVGERTKIAVAATDPTCDAIAACVGRRANRVNYVAGILGVERIEIIAWHPERDRYLTNALAPARPTGVTFDGEIATVTAPAHQMSAAVGRAGLNSQLAAQLVGLVAVTVVAE